MLMTSQTFIVFAEEAAAQIQKAESEVTVQESETAEDADTGDTSTVEKSDANTATTYSTTSDTMTSITKPGISENVEQPFSAKITEREQINLNTGGLQYTETLVSLPGINGNDLNLQITYDSSSAVLQDLDYTIYYNDDGWDHVEYTDYKTHEQERYDIGAGWTFNIPSIDYVTDDREGAPRLILPGTGSFVFYKSTSNYTFESYLLKDMTITDDSSYTAGQFPSDKKLTMADGTVYYFSEDGLLLAALDRFGNTIRYRYAQVDGNYHPCEIIDTVGRSTTIVYADTETGKRITITAPDTGITILETRNLGDDVIYTDETISVLDCIIFPDGETITFDYRYAYGAYWHITDTNVAFAFAHLCEVTYDTGMQLHYVYREHAVSFGDSDDFTSYPISKRYITTNDSDEVVAEYLQYIYDGSYGICDVTNVIGEYYEYSSTVIEHSATGTKAVTYTFDSSHHCIEQQTTVNDELYQKVTTEYDTYNLPCKTVTETYGDGTVTTTTLSTHDKYGNTLTTLSPKGEGDADNTEYRTTYTYDATYQLPLTVEYKQNASTTVRMENTLTADSKSILSTVTKVNGTAAAKTSYTYDAQGRVLTETAYPDVNLDNGIVTEYTYSGANLASNTVKNVTGNDGVTVDLTVSYTYDTMGRPLTATDANGNSTTTTYDSRGRVTSVTAPDGSMVAYTYNRFDNRTSVASSGREPVVYNYDALGQLESVVYASGDLTVENFYDANGNLVAETTNRDSTASGTAYYTYDVFDRVTEKTIYNSDNTLLYRETYAYNDAVDDSTSLVTKTVHGNAHAASIVTKTYTNKYGETVKEDVGGVVTQYAYDYVGNPIRVYYGDTTLMAYTYDYAGNVLTETNADGNTRTVTYDGLGRKLTESDFKGNVTSYTYDNAGRLLTMTAPLTETKNSVTKYYYDANGNIVKTMQSAEAENSTEAVWRTAEQVYDSMNRVTDIINYVSDSDKQYTHYKYNLAGDLTDVYTGMTVPFNVAGTDSYSHIEYTYDNHGNNTAITDALGQTESYTYDVLGMLTAVTQRDGTKTSYTYNALGNVVADTVGSSAQNTTYTLTGAVKSVTIDGETVEYTYDGLGNILTETEGNTVKTYTYDSRGRKSGYTLKINGTQISSATYVYDTSDRLISVTEGGQTTTYTYDANGNRASQTTDGVTTTYTYNNANLVTGMVNKMGDVVISSFTYTYYADGNMYTKAETQLDVTTNTTYVYDGMGRLKSETIGEDVISYYYDANGNRTLMNNDGDITSYTYDKNNRLLTESANGETITYTYDANGNTLSAGDKTYTYNARGQQIGYTDGTVTASYAYNLSGLRSIKTVNGSTKYFVYNGMQIVFEYDDGVSDGTVYYYGLNRTHSSNGDVYVYNAHGDTVQLVNTNAVVASYTYDAFGNLTNTVGTSDNAFLYCSEYFDAETQTYYLRARYYNPANGRFTQQDAWAYIDASDPLSLNLYTYCYSNPVRYIDPTGRITQEEIKMYEDGLLSQDVYDILIDLTNRWINAETQAAKNEIHGLAEQFRNNNYAYQDLSLEAAMQLYENGQMIDNMTSINTTAAGHLFILGAAGLKWYALVDNNGIWDYKVKPASWMPRDMTYFMFGGRLISFADFGNINYGYTGTVLGLSPEMLYQGAGYVQSGTINTEVSQYYGDSEVDFNNVQQGIAKANSLGYTGNITLPLSLIFKIMKGA